MRCPPLSVVKSLWSSPIGVLLLAAHEQALCGLWFEDQKGVPDWAVQARPAQQHPMLNMATEQLQSYFDGQCADFNIPLDFTAGTPFQQIVWKALQTIPCGETTSYGEIARRIGKPAAVRAVGGAIGRNPIGIIVPCHRVVGQDGSLTGYTGGLDRKTALLRLESA